MLLQVCLRRLVIKIPRSNGSFGNILNFDSHLTERHRHVKVFSNVGISNVTVHTRRSVKIQSQYHENYFVSGNTINTPYVFP